jgi:hypothetical protein
MFDMNGFYSIASIEKPNVLTVYETDETQDDDKKISNQPYIAFDSAFTTYDQGVKEVIKTNFTPNQLYSSEYPFDEIWTSVPDDDPWAVRIIIRHQNNYTYIGEAIYEFLLEAGEQIKTFESDSPNGNASPFIITTKRIICLITPPHESSIKEYPYSDMDWSRTIPHRMIQCKNPLLDLLTIRFDETTPQK